MIRKIRFLNISDREWPRVALICVLFFLLMLGWGFGAAGRNAFFIKEIGPEKLPHLYIFNAIVLVFFSNIYFRIVDRISLYKLFIGLLALSGFGFLGLRLVIPFKFYWLPFVIFFFSELVLQILISMHFWTVANHLFNPREGKRIFPIIAGAGLGGIIVGGAITAIIVEMIGTPNLFLLWSILLFSLVPIVCWINRTIMSRGDFSKSPKNKLIENETGIESSGLKEIWKIPIIRYMAYAAVPMWIVVNIIDYQYLRTMNEVIQDQDRLTGFFGILSSTFAASGLLLQLVLTTRLLDRFGVASMVYVHPIAMSIGSMGLCLRSVFTSAPTKSIFSFRSISAIIASFSDDTIVNSIGDSTSQLLFNSIPESKRGRSRAFLYGTVEPICSVLSGILLLVLLKLDTSELLLSSILIIFCAIWILLSFKIKSQYLHALIDNLGSGSVELRAIAMGQLANVSDRNSLQILEHGLTSKDEDVALYALEILKQSKIRNLQERLRNVLPHVIDGAKIAILNTIADSGDRAGIPIVRPLVDDNNKRLSATAIRTIGKLGEIEDIRSLDRFLESTDLQVRAEAMIALLNWNLNNQSKVLDTQSLLTNLAQCPQSLLRAKVAYVIGEVRSKDYLPVLLELSNTDDDDVINEIIIASRKIRDKGMVPELVSFLQTERYTHQVINAICGFGDLAVDALHHALMSTKIHENTQKHILICLGKIGNPRSIPKISRFLTGMSHSTTSEIAGITALNEIKQELLQKTNFNTVRSLNNVMNPELLSSISQNLKQLSVRIQSYSEYLICLKSIKNQKAVLLLFDALERFMKLQEEIAFKYLEFISDPLASKTASHNLKSDNYRTRSEALEVLEASSHEGKVLAKILEPIYLQTKSRDRKIEASELFTQFLGENYPQWLRVCTIYSIGELKLSELSNPLMNHYKSWKDRLTNPLIKNHILCAMTKISSGKIKGFDAGEIEGLNRDMKKIQFLRSVSLFAEMDGSDLYWISTILKVKEYGKNEILYRQGEHGDSIGLIESGRVRETSEKTRNHSLGVLKEGECFGELSIFDKGSKWHATGEALEETTILMIRQNDFQELLLARPSLGIALSKRVISRLRTAIKKVADA